MKALKHVKGLKAWSGFGQMHVVLKRASVRESLGSVLAERKIQG